MTLLRRFAAFLFVVGVALSPLRAVAATVPMVIACDAAVRSTATTRIETCDVVREAEHRAATAYDRGRLPYDNAPKPRVAAGARPVHAYDGPSTAPVGGGVGVAHAYDDALTSTEWRELSEGATYDACVTPTAAEGADMALGLATRPAGGGDTLLNQFAEGIGAKTYGQLTGSWWPGSYEALEANLTTEMNGARSLHFNLEGMDMGRFAEFAKNPVMGPGNVTNWELFSILKNPSLLGKTTFYGGVPPAL